MVIIAKGWFSNSVILSTLIIWYSIVRKSFPSHPLIYYWYRLMDFYFIQWVIIHYYHHLFWSPKYPAFLQYPPAPVSHILWHISIILWALSFWHVKIFWTQLVFSRCQLWICHFFQEAGSFQWGISILIPLGMSRMPFRWTDLGTHMHTRTVTHRHMYLFLCMCISDHIDMSNFIAKSQGFP